MTLSFSVLFLFFLFCLLVLFSAYSFPFAAHIRMCVPVCVCRCPMSEVCVVAATTACCMQPTGETFTIVLSGNNNRGCNSVLCNWQHKKISEPLPS